MTRASRGLLGLLFALAVAAAVPSTAAAERVLLAGQPGLSAAQRAEVRQEAGVRRTAAASFADGEVVSVPDARSGEALRALNASPDVRFAMPDVTFHLATDDVYWTNQWALNAPNDVDINAPEAWTLSTGAGVTVAVIDTGVDAGHPDLAGHVRSDGYAYVAGAPTADAVGHGTHVAGIIAAVRNNGRGVAGAAPDATILPLKAFGSDDADAEDVVSAFDRAGRAGMRVVSGSFSTLPQTDPEDAATLRTAFDRIFGRYPNTLFVVAAGNVAPASKGNNDDAVPTFPCSSTAANLICVGANTPADRVAFFSDYGAVSVDLFAPGQNIWSTWTGGMYRAADGTSMSTPFVAAEAALLLSRVPRLSAVTLKNLILSTVHRVPAYQGLSVSGGRADAYAALLQAVRDTDADGVQDVIDSCPTLAAAGPDGCPVVPRPPVPAPAPLAGKPAGGPVGTGQTVAVLPRLRALSAKAEPCRRGRACRRTATVRLTPDRSARASVKVDLRRCSGRRCRWSRVFARTLTVGTSGARVTVKGKGRTGLARGSYRVTVVLSSAAGSSRASTRTFKVR